VNPHGSTLPIFLGVTEHAARRLVAWDLIGLTRTLALPYFPQTLAGLKVVLAIPHRWFANKVDVSFTLRFVDLRNSGNTAWLAGSIRNMAWEAAGGEVVHVPRFLEVPQSSAEGQDLLMSIGGTEEATDVMIFPAPPLNLPAPTDIRVDLEIDGVAHPIGSMSTVFVQPPPISDSERKALMAMPKRPGILMFGIGCPICKERKKYFLTLQPDDERIRELSVESSPLLDAPDDWVCSCGTRNSLVWLKQGAHDLFRRPPGPGTSSAISSFIPLYQSGKIEELLEQYSRLIHAAPPEEDVQKFLEQNPVFWGFLSPSRILSKPAVLTKKRADFGVVSSTHVLYLIELEKPTTALLTKKGKISAEIQAGADQIRDWELVVQDHRSAFLSELGLDPSKIHEVRYVLVGGLARSVKPSGLAKLRHDPFGSKTQFFCFDELAAFLRLIQGHLNDWWRQPEPPGADPDSD